MVRAYVTFLNLEFRLAVRTSMPSESGVRERVFIRLIVVPDYFHNFFLSNQNLIWSFLTSHRTR